MELMLGLTLREEFRGKRLKGTAIELSNDTSTGATQIASCDFLEITYPTHDLLKGIEAVAPDQGRPIVIIGERGLGKSHLMATLYHAVHDPISTSAWLNSWSATLEEPSIASIPLRNGMLVIGESLHRQRYKFLWDLLFENHPNGTYIKGKWEGMGEAKTDIPSDKLIIELLQNQPTMLLLDEFQTWYDGLTNAKQSPLKNWAFNFIQILSEIAKEHPELLVLVVSVRNGDTDAYQQIHRVNPVQIDFKAGGNPERIQQDRRRMLLHRLFTNRLQISTDSIESLLAVHINEYFRLLDIPTSEQERKRKEFVDSFPYAPHLLQLLEDQVLVATDAQETRDLIRILANLFKGRGDKSPILTAADFCLDDDESGIGTLLDSVSNQQHRSIREKALRNIISVQEAVPNYATEIPHLQEIFGALWLRSIAVGNLAGAEPTALQADITKSNKIDNNRFQVELSTIIENSFNLHQEGSRLVFREDENPQAKLMACARNDKLFADGSDLVQLAKEVRYVIGGAAEVAKTCRVIVLPKSWLSSPWESLDESEHPDRWDERLPLLILPEEPDNLNGRLGLWIKDKLKKRRNTIRFLLPRSGSLNLFQDRDLLILTRASMKAEEWSGQQGTEYKKLHSNYQRELRDIIKNRFDRFAVLQRWSYTDSSQCVFSIESLRVQGSQIPQAVEEALARDLFIPEDFEDLVLEAAANNSSIGKLLGELQEPRPVGDCIPWLGETLMKERVIRLCAKGKIAINLRGQEYLQTQPAENEDSAWLRLRSKLSYTGRQLHEIFLLSPSAVPTTGGATAIPEITPVVPVPNNANDDDDATPPEKVIKKPEFDSSEPPVIGNIFDGGTKQRVSLSNPATSSLNLIGKLEGWGVSATTQVSEVSIKISSATGYQLKELLKKLPDGMTFELSLEKEDS